MIFVVGEAFSQNHIENPSLNWLTKSFTDASKPLNLISIFKPVTLPARQVIAPGFYVAHLSFFCRQEIKLEKVIKVPFRFRLGSVEDCDRMEGKVRKNAPRRFQ